MPPIETDVRNRLVLAVRRAIAGAIDVVAALGVAVALADGPGVHFAELAVGTFRIGEPDTLWRGPIPLVLGLFGPIVYGLPFAGAIVLAIEALTGFSLGKLATRLRVVDLQGETTGGRGRAMRIVGKGAPPALALLGLGLERFEILVAGSILGVALALEALVATGQGRPAAVDQPGRTDVRGA